MTETATTPAGMAGAIHFFPWWAVLIQGLVALIIGILFLFYPYSTLFVLVVFLGAYWFVNGIFSLISLGMDKTHMGWKIVIGIMGIIAGILILAYPYYSAIIVPTIFVIMIGIWGIIMGFLGLGAAFKGAGWGVGILGILGIIFGFVILINPLITALFLPYILGVFGIVGGLSAIAYSFKLKGEQGSPAA